MPRQYALKESSRARPTHQVFAEVGNLDDTHGFTHGFHFRSYIVVAAVATERRHLVCIGGIVGEP